MNYHFLSKCQTAINHDIRNIILYSIMIASFEEMSNWKYFQVTMQSDCQIVVNDACYDEISTEFHFEVVI